MTHLGPPGVPDVIITHRDPGRHSRGKQTMFCHVFVAVLFSNLRILRAHCEHWPVNVCTVPTKLASCALPKCIWLIVLHLFSLQSSQGLFLLVTQHSYSTPFLPESDGWHGVYESLWSRKDGDVMLVSCNSQGGDMGFLRTHITLILVCLSPQIASITSKHYASWYSHIKFIVFNVIVVKGSCEPVSPTVRNSMPRSWLLHSSPSLCSVLVLAWWLDVAKLFFFPIALL